jgi:hypothetical protein
VHRTNISGTYQHISAIISEKNLNKIKVSIIIHLHIFKITNKGTLYIKLFLITVLSELEWAICGFLKVDDNKKAILLFSSSISFSDNKKMLSLLQALEADRVVRW